MTDFLIKLFVKNSQNVKNMTIRKKYGMLSGITGIVVNIILFAAKLAAGLFFNSIAIFADAVNNLSDAGSSTVTFIGFKLSAKPADPQHPYGHARYEYIAGLIVSFIIVMFGINLALSSFNKIIRPEPVSFSLITAAILIAAVLVKLWLWRFYSKIAQKISSDTIKATGTDSRNDVLITSAVLFSLLTERFTGFQSDGYIGILIALFITYSGIKLIKETLSPLLGETPDKTLVETVQKKILSYDGVVGLHELVVHNYGPGRCFASVHVEVDYKQDIMVSHDIIDNIEKHFLSENSINLVIHLDPVVTDDPETNRLKKITEKIVTKIDPVLSIHDFRMVNGKTHNNLIFDVVTPVGYELEDNELIKIITDMIKAQTGENNFAVIGIDRSYTSC